MKYKQGGELHQVLTLQVDHNVRDMAIEMQDTNLIAKISSGDMVAIESKYHTKCILAYRRKFAAFKSSTETTTTCYEKASKARAFAELISYLEEECAQQANQRAACEISISHDSERDITLPSEYATVEAVALKTSEVNIPVRLKVRESQNDTSQLPDAISKEQHWLEHCRKHLDTELTKGSYVSWAGYHASLIESSRRPLPCLSGILPLFDEKAATVSMMKHGLDVQKKVTEYLNPGQVPVTVCDQPLFAIAKSIQWQWPESYGEDVHIVMLGGLHIEMALWSVCGDLLEASGWTTALTEAGVSSSGTSEAFLKVSHLTKTRLAHQITCAALHTLLDNAYEQLDGEDDDIQNWQNDMLRSSPTFKFWHMIMQLELTILTFVRAHRENNFTLYVEVLQALAPWFFALDHINYSRWLPLHIRDMENLPDSIQEKFKECWVIHKTSNKFSSIPIDQAHEQNNAILKGSGGIIGLTENPVAFRRWLVAGPEVARCLEQFEDASASRIIHENREHHEQGLSTQKNFKTNVKSLVSTIADFGNPFLYDCPELVVLDTRNCTDESVVKTVRNVEELGSRQYKSRLYIGSQQRDGDLNEFFSHENQPYPPSLSDFGNLRFTKKSDLVLCITKGVTQTPPPQSYDVKVFDGAAVVVHSLPVSAASTFAEYATVSFLPYIHSTLNNTSRTDIIWDDYRQASLKEAILVRREERSRCKEEEQVSNTIFPVGKIVAITSGESIAVNQPQHQMQACNHEEADTRLLVHVRDAVERGAKNVMIRTVDTDVVVIAVAELSALREIEPDLNIWIAFVIERFVVVLYDKNSSATCVNTARRELFTKKARTLETIPPTKPECTLIERLVVQRMKKNF
ncbi:hypothetical protein QZH41_006309 [Actinostola sp. cb2023]|nr:hypothetical protein QZH41_006309 [Actinostola sp. cb2023]